MRLLLVEDEQAISAALSRSMRKWGHEVHVAGNLSEARKLAAEHAPEALVSDLKLPDGQGLDFARTLGVPFILMSGYACFDDAVDALRLGCVDFLTKPVAMQDLRASLGRLNDRFSSWEMCIIKPGDDELQLLRPTAVGVDQQAFFAQELSWNSREQAEEVFASVQETGDRERRLLAELCQSADEGRVVVNRGPTWWRAWLEADVDWRLGGAIADRRHFIESLADRCIFRPNSCVVEFGRDDS